MTPCDNFANIISTNSILPSEAEVKKCKCGSTSHLRISHQLCSLNKLNSHVPVIADVNDIIEEENNITINEMLVKTSFVDKLKL